MQKSAKKSKNFQKKKKFANKHSILLMRGKVGPPNKKGLYSFFLKGGR